MKILPRAKQILVRPDEAKSRENEAGIITPENVEQEQKSIGTVEAVGTGIEDVKAGDRVLYGTFAGEDVYLDGGRNPNNKIPDYKVLFDEDVLALVEDEAK